MTAPIGPVGGLSGPRGITPINTDIAGPQGAVAAGDGEDFASKLSQGLQWVQGLQSRTDDLQVQAATGSLKDVHDYMIASAESGIATSLTVAVRNKAIEAFQEIMRMQA
jgi:flagellar hook-basal body complex protein FliE